MLSSEKFEFMSYFVLLFYKCLIFWAVDIVKDHLLNIWAYGCLLTSHAINNKWADVYYEFEPVCI
jgi:hypothetical protein